MSFSVKSALVLIARAGCTFDSSNAISTDSGGGDDGSSDDGSADAGRPDAAPPPPRILVHINHDITYSVDNVHSGVLQVFANLAGL